MQRKYLKHRIFDLIDIKLVLKPRRTAARCDASEINLATWRFSHQETEIKIQLRTLDRLTVFWPLPFFGTEAQKWVVRMAVRETTGQN